MLCLMAVVCLAPLSKVLKDDGAPEMVAAIPLGLAVLFFVGMLHALYKFWRTESK
jgi:hypothetical protein